MRLNYDTFMQEEENQKNFSTMEYGFFSIKTGETSTVRFMVDDIKDFDLEVVHKVSLSDGKVKNISCLGEGCPLCEAGIKQTKRIYIPMIQYFSDGTQKAVVWDRDKEYALRLRNYLNDYGPLSDILCNVTREGSGLDTKYIISPNVHVRDAENFPKIQFPDVEPSKYCMSVKTAEDMNAFIETGEFPQKSYGNNNSTSIPVDSVPEVPFVEEPVVQTPAANNSPVQSYGNLNTANTTMRPRRY